MNESRKKTVSVVLPLELYQRLAAQAEQTSRSLSAYIRQVLKEYVQYLDRFQKR